jgi:hypothetical protein
MKEGTVYTVHYICRFCDILTGKRGTRRAIEISKNQFDLIPTKGEEVPEESEPFFRDQHEDHVAYVNLERHDKYSKIQYRRTYMYMLLPKGEGTKSMEKKYDCPVCKEEQTVELFPNQVEQLRLWEIDPEMEAIATYIEDEHHCKEGEIYPVILVGFTMDPRDESVLVRTALTKYTLPKI